MLIDFKELKRVLNKTLERFDHVYLNDLEDFKPPIQARSASRK
jgi:6-pyruvoyl-tetrahydropterin synthase